MKEIWKYIEGYDKEYKVSNLGRVWSLKSNRLMAVWDNGLGYCFYRLSHKNKYKNWSAHRLVAMHFIKNPLGCKEVNHIDTDKRNNRVDNLEWCDHSRNMLHAYKNKLISNRVLSDEDVRYIRSSNLRQFQLAKKFNVSTSAIYNILINKTYN